MVCVTFTRKNLFACLLVLIMTAMIFCEFAGCFNIPQNAATNKDRTDFAKGVGYDVCDGCTQTKKVTLPYNINDEIYKQSNGYNLYDFAGCFVTVYTYVSADNKGMLDIFVYRDRVIGYKWKNNGLINS